MIVLRDRRAARDGAGQAAAHAAGRLRGHLRGHGRPSLSPSASWIRRCTSSCPPRRRTSQQLAKEMGKIPLSELKAIIAGLHEFNPMMGHRGCRLAVTYPEIAEMQTRAVIKAALNVTGEPSRLEHRARDHDPAGRRGQGAGKYRQGRRWPRPPTSSSRTPASSMHYKVGTMIEIPRAALTADEIAKEAEFFSFGTNDLTQMTFGFSRDDAGKFLDAYYDKKIYESDPFATSGPGRRRHAGQDGCRAGPSDPPRHQAGHLRRARRRSVLRGVLPPASA